MKRYRRSDKLRITRGEDGAPGATSGAGQLPRKFVLWPHRLLGWRATFLLALATGIAMTAVLVSFGLGPLQAWPVVGCMSLTFFGLALALWVNHRSTRMAEIIEINPHVVHVARLSPATPQRQEKFNATWLRISVRSDRTVTNPITLCENGRSMSIGEFLSPQERIALAEALKASLRTAAQ